MKKWQKVLLIIIAILLAGGAGWWWVARDYVTIKTGNTNVFIKGVYSVGKASLDKKEIIKVLDNLGVSNQSNNIVLNFVKYKDQDFENSLVLIKGSYLSVGAMMCTGPIIDANGKKIVTVYVSPKVFKEKFGEQATLERENDLVLFCMLKAIMGENINDEMIIKISQEKYTVIKSLKI